MRVIYNGPHPEVVVDELDTDQVIVAGQPVNVPDELGARLLEQNTWVDAADDQSKASPVKVAEAALAAAKPADSSPINTDTSTKGNS